jgi:DNA-binding FrmR family transcriptional regulator
MQDKKDLDARLASIEGHIKGIRKMVRDDTYCIDVLKQTYAVDRALKKFESQLLRGHLASCVPTAIEDGRKDEVMTELADVLELARR